MTFGSGSIELESFWIKSMYILKIFESRLFTWLIEINRDVSIKFTHDFWTSIIKGFN